MLKLGRFLRENWEYGKDQFRKKIVEYKITKRVEESNQRGHLNTVGEDQIQAIYNLDI